MKRYPALNKGSKLVCKKPHPLMHPEALFEGAQILFILKTGALNWHYTSKLN